MLSKGGGGGSVPASARGLRACAAGYLLARGCFGARGFAFPSEALRPAQLHPHQKSFSSSITYIGRVGGNVGYGC